jgi:hypothetical protein
LSSNPALVERGPSLYELLSVAAEPGLLRGETRMTKTIETMDEEPQDHDDGT